MGRSSIQSLLANTNGGYAKLHYDSHIGIYVIMCISKRRVYVGQSVNVPNRLRGHRMHLRGGKYATKSKGLSDMQSDYDDVGLDGFHFAQICSCSGGDLYAEETGYLKDFLDDGWAVYNHFVNTEVTGMICPESFKVVVQRVVNLLDRGKLTVQELDHSLDQLEMTR